MKALYLSRIFSVCLMAASTGCVVAPAPHRPVVVAPAGPAVVIEPAPVITVAPTYAMPAPGYVWVQHPRFGWGWRHPVHGWHRGWR